MDKKFFPLDQLKSVISELRKKNKTIALANGGFDLLHIGHIRYLEAARKQADILVVALNSDRSLQHLKGPKRPIINEGGRVKMLAALSCVDFVTLFNENRVDRVLSTLKPDFHCKGSDYTEETVPERETVRSYGGRIVIVGGAKVKSTSDIVRHIKQLDKKNDR